MATIKRRRDRSGRWEVRYRDPQGRQRARLFDRKVDAERFATTTGADIVRGNYLNPALGRLNFARFVDQDSDRRWSASKPPPGNVTSPTCGRTSFQRSAKRHWPRSTTRHARRG